jgi:hypothetical protein
MFNIKKRFFKRELKRIQAEIWNQEFGRYTTLFKREKTRQLIDSGNDVLDRMKANKNTPKEQIEDTEKKLEALKKEVDWFDTVLDGGKHNTPEGEIEDQGINNRLETLVEKRELTKNFIKQYC